MQAKDTSVQEAVNVAKLAITFIKRQRADTAYEFFYLSVVLQARKLLMILFCHAIKDHQNICSAPHVLTSRQEYFRAFRGKYFEALNFVENEISRRFDQGSQALPNAIDFFI